MRSTGESGRDGETAGCSDRRVLPMTGFDGPGLDGTDGSKHFVDAGRALSTVDPAVLSEDERFGVLDDLERTQRALDAARLRFTTAVDGATDLRFGHRTGPWLSNRHGGTVGARKRDLRIARVLATHYPVLERAFLDGNLPLDRAAVIVRATSPGNVDALSAAQHELLDLSAVTVSFRQFETDVNALAAVADHDGVEPDPDRESKLSMSRSGDELHLRGLLRGATGFEVEAFLDAAADRLFHQRRRDDDTTAGDLPTPTRDALLAAALADGLARGHTADITSTQSPKVGVTLNVTELDPSRTWEGLELWGRRRRVLLGSMSLRTSTGTVELFCCDPVLDALLHTTNGDVIAALDLDRGMARQRVPSRDQRRAAASRDGGCVFPGCGAPPSWTDLHHVQHWADDGPTELWNLASLCRFHHGVVHRNNWTMTTTGDGWFQITTPTGQVLDTQRHGRQRERTVPA